LSRDNKLEGSQSVPRECQYPTFTNKQDQHSTISPVRVFISEKTVYPHYKQCSMLKCISGSAHISQ